MAWVEGDAATALERRTAGAGDGLRAGDPRTAVTASSASDDRAPP